MPRQISRDDDRPRRRRGAKAIAIEADSERGLAMRILLHSPKDMVAGALAFAAVSAIIANALFLQAGRHPAPMFGSVTVMPAASSPANPLPRPRPVEADAAQPEAKACGAESRRSAGQSGQGDQRCAGDADRCPAAAGGYSAIVPQRHRAIPGAGSRRVAAVQRALTEYGYGQLKPTGTAGSDTQAAIQKFERTRKLPVTGQMSDRLVRELTAMIGHPID